jgi:hypothetical protein
VSVRTNMNGTSKKQVRTASKKAKAAATNPQRENDALLRDLAVAKLHEDAKVKEPDREIPWGRLSDDKSRIVVGSTDGNRAVFGVYAVTKDGQIGEAEPFNFSRFELTWRGKKEHPTKAETEADEAELLKWLEKNA